MSAGTRDRTAPLTLIFVTPSSPEPVGGVLALWAFANALARRGNAVHLVHVPMWGRRVRTLDELSRYRFEPSITHYFEDAEPEWLPEADIIFGTGGTPRMGLPVLLVQGFDTLHPALEIISFRTPCLKVCVTTWLVDALRAFGVPADQLRVAPMGIDHERFRIERPIDSRPRRVAMLHGLHAAKGWPTGRRALELAHERLPDLEATVFGTSEPEEPLPAWMTFVHDPSPEVLAGDVYNGSAIFLQASNYEGFGFTAVEAMACGCALVTTDTGGSRDFAVPGQTAVVARAGDAEALAAAIVGLATDPERRIRLARAGHELVQGFDWGHGAAVLEEHLRDYLADPERFLGPPEPNTMLTAERGQGELAAAILEATRADHLG